MKFSWKNFSYGLIMKSFWNNTLCGIITKSFWKSTLCGLIMSLSLKNVLNGSKMWLFWMNNSGITKESALQRHWKYGQTRGLLVSVFLLSIGLLASVSLTACSAFPPVNSSGPPSASEPASATNSGTAPPAANPDATSLATSTKTAIPPKSTETPSPETSPDATEPERSPDATQPATGTETGLSVSDTKNGNNFLPITDIKELLSKLSLEQKVGQLMFPAFRTDTQGEPLTVLNDATKEILQKWQPGGVILFSQNIQTVRQCRTLVAELQKTARLPLFIGTDEEGGIVSRLAAAKQLGAVSMPQAGDIGKTGNTDLARQAAVATGKQLQQLGINLNFAPDADVNTNPQNPVIGNRAYGTKPEETAAMVAAALQGYTETHIIPVVKHFPGHGDTTTDSHDGLAVVPHNMNRLKSVELVPFEKAIAAGVPIIMTAHVHTPGISKLDVPATLNPDVLTGLLRNTLGFQGIIITDAMEMGAITESFGEAEAVMQAILAGADILLVPANLETACLAILQAVKDGLISEERLDASVYRILSLKQTAVLVDTVNAASLLDAELRRLPETISGTEEFKAVVARIQKK